jgi:hypothetical protein
MIGLKRMSELSGLTCFRAADRRKKFKEGRKELSKKVMESGGIITGRKKLGDQERKNLRKLKRKDKRKGE